MSRFEVPGRLAILNSPTRVVERRHEYERYGGGAVQFAPTWFSATIASPICTAPLGGPERYGFAELGIVRSYSWPSVMPLALKSEP